MTTEPAADQLELLNRLQRILSEGGFVATYKYALILALAELSIEKSAAGDDAVAIPLAEIAERFIALYWRQSAPYGPGVVLHQSTGRQASAISRIADFRAHAATLSAARRHTRWATLVRDIGNLLVEMPLWRLQRVGTDRLDFLYEERLVDGAIVLRPGIARFFQCQFSIIQALVQMAWLSFVQRRPENRPLLGATGDLADFLFGSERSALAALIEGLNQIQLNGCFYCDGALADEIDVDHFIPWSRYPRDLGHNFVLAHPACNRSKADMLAAPVHLERWIERNQRHEPTLQHVFAEAHFIADADASFSVTEWAYDIAERAGSLVWTRGKQMCRLKPEWRTLFRR